MEQNDDSIVYVIEKDKQFAIAEHIEAAIYGSQRSTVFPEVDARCTSSTIQHDRIDMSLAQEEELVSSDEEETRDI